MARRENCSWSLKWSSLLASLAFISVANGAILTSGGPSTETTDDVVIDVDVDDADLGQDEVPVPLRSQEPTCRVDPNKDRFLMLVSTMDGKVSALNIAKGGSVEWSVDAGSAPLLSSSISYLEIKRDGVPTRLIPSLDGALFQFDGDVIEPLPFTADSLLSSTFRFQEDSMVVGGKGSETYGIDTKTGKVQYICSASGCKAFGDGSAAEDDILVITRHTKTVRAVEMRSGTEKWNFSVGEHEVSYIRSAKASKYDYIGHGDSTRQPEVSDPDASVETCDDPEEASDEWFSWFSEGKSDLDLNDVELKVIVPQGLVAAVSKSNPSHILWQHKFPHAVANAWTLREGKLADVSLFDDTHIPALTQSEADTETETSDNGIPPQPVLYVGSHQNQPYVQPSVLLVNELEHAAAGAEPGALLSMPQVRWRPYLATAMTRTPAVTSMRNPLQISWEAEDHDCDEHHVSDEQGMAIWHEQYPYDGGFYLYPDYTPLNLHSDQNNSSDSINQSVYNKYIGTIMFWNWWKEVVATSIVVSILVHLVVMKYIRKMSRKANENTVSQSQSKSQEDQLTIESETLTEKPQQQSSAESPTPYTSRYYTDFDQQECLGRGGFGVVFLAVNKMDDCEYAIKRIALTNSERAKKKVMREVKALAKLDHTGIVRYYQSWFENPPQGWQEEIDRKCVDMSSLTPTQGISDYTPGAKASHSLKPGGPQGDHITEDDSFAKLGIKNPLRMHPTLPFGSSEELSEEVTENESKRAGSTEGFVPLHGLPSDDESGSFSLSSDSQSKQNYEDSFSVSFRDDSNSVPFEAYTRPKMFEKLNDSLDIVFEDSGCGEKSSTGDNAVIDVPMLDHSEAQNKVDESENEVKGHQRSSKANQKETVALPGKMATRPEKLSIASVDSERSIVNPLPKLYLYIQMQLCQRESLKDWLNKNTLHRDRLEKLTIFHQIVDAVNYVHINGLMHRDLKPSNIFFSKDGVVKVGDFGLATALEEQFDSESELYQHTPTNQYTNQVGTKLYMSPEQTAGKAYTHSVDIYALGMIFFELFYPFATQMERIKTLLEVRELKFPDRFVRELPHECLFVKPLLSHNPGERPSTADILVSPLMTEAHDMMQLMARARTRTRTTSSSSGGSVSTAL